MHEAKMVKTGINKGGINDSPYLMSGAYRDRTGDLLIANQALSQLS